MASNIAWRPVAGCDTARRRVANGVNDDALVVVDGLGGCRGQDLKVGRLEGAGKEVVDLPFVEKGALGSGRHRAAPELLKEEQLAVQIGRIIGLAEEDFAGVDSRQVIAQRIIGQGER